MQILIVDDDTTTLFVTCALIRRIDGVEPVAMANPWEALSWLEQNAPDLIMIDQIMPELDGMALLERLRAHRHLASVPVVMVTAETSIGLRVAALERGCTDFLTKPIVVPELLARVQNLLKLRVSQHLLNARAATLSSRVDEVTDLLGRQAKETEAVRRDSEFRFRTLADSIPQLAWMAQPDGSMLWCNRRWCDYTGSTFDAMRHSGWSGLVHPDHAERVAARFQRSLETGEPWEDTFPLRGRYGEWRSFLSRALPVRDPDGTIVQWFGTNTDVTEQHEAEEALRRAKEAAEQAVRLKSTFLASASHDLRQPMQSLFLFAGTLHGHVQGESGRTALAHLERGLDVMKSLLDGLLDVSRLDAGVVRPMVEDFPACDLLAHIAASYAPVARGKGLDWRMAECRLTVRSDRVLLGRIVRNLVENAVRYTRSGGVSVDCEVVGTRLRIAVRDTGIGIPANQLERIWEEFHQIGNSERDRAQGLGLGLAIVQRISRLLDLPVLARSELGQGSVFSVEVPLGTEAAPAERPPQGCTVAPGGHERFAVVVDDDVIVLLGLQAILKEWGYRVLVAGSGVQAVEKLRVEGRVPDVIIADYRLRDGLVGTDAILAIHALFERAIPSILVTGETGPECQHDAALHGFGLMHKPVTPRQLGSAVTRFLNEANPVPA